MYDLLNKPNKDHSVALKNIISLCRFFAPRESRTLTLTKVLVISPSGIPTIALSASRCMFASRFHACLLA